MGAPEDAKAPDSEAKGLRILVLGGTAFLGPAIVRAALARGHVLTLFNRGRTNPGLFPEVEKLRGDRNGDLDALKDRSWDAVIDTSAYVPRVTQLSAALLRKAIKQYVFISTISVYPGFGTSDETLTEESAVGTLADPTDEKVTGDSYGPLKALCEEVVRTEYPDGATIVRPGLIVGPGDPTDRFTWWPARVARGGEIAAPGDGSTPVQVIDVRDLGEWLVHLVEQRVHGCFNAVGFDGALNFEEFLHGLKCALNTSATYQWVDEAVLEAQGVAPFMGMPLWIPKGKLPTVANQRAIAAGLKFRPVTTTAQDTLTWLKEARPEGRLNPRLGLSAEREAALLAAAAAARVAR